MAKTSEFALNLLDELRSRKERMVTSKTTAPMVADVYASNSKTAYKSSREPKTLKNTGFSAGSTQNRPSRGKKSVTAASVSNQIVPFVGGQKSAKLGKLSLTLAFAVENGGKLGRTSSSGNSPTFSFLHNIGRKQMERRNSTLPNISHLRIEEISRGVQKLNQILRDCSNGLNFDKFSIEIGGELLKGAMDLEESLRMLVNLQDASEYSITKRRNNRITLLEENGDDDDDDEKRLDTSGYSFGRASRSSNDIQGVSRTVLRLKHLAYSSEGTEFKHGKKVVAASNSHPGKRSVGYDLDIKTLTAFSEQNHSSSLQCKEEKLRIPNVIAKLMGLDELPGHVDSTVTTRVAVHDKLPPRKDLEDIKPMTSSRKTTSKIDRRQSDIVQLSHNYPSTKGIQERKNDSVKHRDHKMAETSEIKEPVFKDDMKQLIQYAHKRSEAAVTLQAKAKHGENKLHGGNSYANKLLLNYQQKMPSGNGFEQVSALQGSQLQEKRRQSEEMNQQSSKHKLQGKQKKNEPKCGNVSKPMSGATATATNLQKQQPQMKQEAAIRKGATGHIDATHDGRHYKNQASDKGSTNLNIKIQGSLNRNSRQSRRDPDYESSKARILFAVDEKPVQVEKTMTTISTKGCKLEVHRINQVMTNKGASVYNLPRTLKHQNSILRERKQTRLEKLAVSRESNQMKASRFEEVEPKIFSSNKSIANVQSSSVAQVMQKAAKRDSVLCSVLEDECENLNNPQALVQKDSGQNSVPMVTMVTNEKQDQKPDIGSAKESQFKNSASDPLHRINEVNTYEKPQNQRTYTSEMPEPLTESENHFGIPISVLHGNVHNYNEHERKLIMDCGYEVMERKERRRELSAHQFRKVSNITSSKAKSLDDLVKPMCKDFDKLKLYGKEGKEHCSFEDYLPEMVEADVKDKEPELNCMWDLGWNCMMFAFMEKDDVIRDVENYVLNGLLFGITRDLFTAISVLA